MQTERLGVAREWRKQGMTDVMRKDLLYKNSVTGNNDTSNNTPKLQTDVTQRDARQKDIGTRKVTIWQVLSSQPLCHLAALPRDRDRHTNTAIKCIRVAPCGAFNLFIASTSMGQKSFCCHHYHFPEGDSDTNAVFFLCVVQYKWHDRLQMEWMRQGLCAMSYHSTEIFTQTGCNELRWMLWIFSISLV